MDLYDRGYRTTSNKYKLANVCPLNDAELVEWALMSGKCGHLLAYFRDIYRLSGVQAISYFKVKIMTEPCSLEGVAGVQDREGP